jgi:CheY-like chemotaxis protein
MTHKSESNKDILHGAIILIVEDNVINQDVATAMLNLRGMVTEIAENGEQAIEMIKKKDYDCILMDIQMPVMDGNTATRIIRQDPKYKHLPILALTAKVLDSDIKEALAAGMNCHIAKPINLELLLSEMTYWITGSRQNRTRTNLTLEYNDIMEGCLEKVGGNRDLFLKILSVFVEKYSNNDSQVVKMLQEGKNDDAKKLVHSLKGVSLVVGAKELHGITTKLETILLKEPDRELTPVLQQFETQLQDTLTCLKEYIARNSQR